MMEEDAYKKAVLYLKKYQSRLYMDMLEEESNIQVFFQDQINDIQGVLQNICSHDWIEDEFEVAPYEKIIKVCICTICDSVCNK
jgi:hypothetical protein